MKQLKVGDKLYHYYHTLIWGTIEFTEYTIVGETPKFWKVERLGEKYLCKKEDLMIRGTYRNLQKEKDNKLDKEIKRQELINEIDKKAEFITRNKREFWKNGDIEALERLITALDNVIDKGYNHE